MKNYHFYENLKCLDLFSTFIITMQKSTQFFSTTAAHPVSLNRYTRGKEVSLVSLDIEEQYDKIYRYCYFKLHNRETAEDITQETFLRYLEHYSCMTEVSALKCLYTIARNLCVDEYRRLKPEALAEVIPDISMEEKLITNLAIDAALSRMTAKEQELLLLRYVNEVPIAVIGRLYGISRFAVYRRLISAANKFQEELGKEDLYE